MSDLEARVKELEAIIEKYKQWGQDLRNALCDDYYLVTCTKTNKKEVATMANIMDLLYNKLYQTNNIEGFSEDYKVEKLDKEKAEILYGTKKKES